MYLEAPYSGRFGKPTNDKLCPSGLTSCSPSCCSGVARLILNPLSQQPDRDHGDTADWQYNPLCGDQLAELAFLRFDHMQNMGV